jgi:hypothetical protein
MYGPIGSSGPNSPDSNETHESITLSACIIHAVNDLAPYPEGAKKDPFMYWDNEDEITAAVALIKRYVNCYRAVCDFCSALQKFRASR